MRANRREFLWQVGLGSAAGVWAPAMTAWADRLRILGAPGGAAAGESSLVVDRVSPDLRRLLGRIRLGAAQGSGALRVLWLHRGAGDGRPELAVATLDEARAAGTLVVTERDQASVPELIVENRGKAFALMLAGEILLGGKQNRVLREDILLPPASGPRPIGVYCVEQGRWTGSAKGFESRGSFAAPGLRARLMEKADQSRVWAEVNRYAARTAAASPTQSYQEIYDKKEVREHLTEVERAIDARTPPGALGAAVFVGEALAGLDLFGDPGLFAREWPKLLRAQAVEVYGQPPGAGADERRLRDQVEEWLARAGKTEGTLRGSPGVGQLFDFRLGSLRGAALVFDARVVHLALL